MDVRRRALMTLLAPVVLGGCGTIVSRQNRAIGPISAKRIYRLDVVDAVEGTRLPGKLENAHNDPDGVRLFSAAEHCLIYAGDPKKYPDVEPGIAQAAMGTDLVVLFPKGSGHPASGALVEGDPAKWSFPYKGALFAASNGRNLAALKANPDHVLPAVGGYCARAMSGGDVVDGDPRYKLYIADRKTWVFFGRQVGQEAWTALTAVEQAKAYDLAFANYTKYTIAG